MRSPAGVVIANFLEVPTLYFQPNVLLSLWTAASGMAVRFTGVSPHQTDLFGRRSFIAILNGISSCAVNCKNQVGEF